jgi:hypothetical protein
MLFDEFSTNARANRLATPARRYRMQSRDTAYETEPGRVPTSVPIPSSTPEVLAHGADQKRGESEPYSAEEEALVEERLKNLGYL